MELMIEKILGGYRLSFEVAEVPAEEVLVEIMQSIRGTKKIKAMSRGLRNNNPLNIERGSTNWQGLSKEQTDPRFCQFISVALGYRAAFKTLDTYQRKYGLKTIRQFVSRWAPMSENPTDSYVRFVSKTAGIDADKAVSVDDRDTMIKIVAAMSEFENGVPALLKDVEKGYDYFIY